MYAKYIHVVILISIFTFITSQNNTDNTNSALIGEIMKLMDTCLPMSAGIDYLSKIQTDCRKLKPYENIYYNFTCCEIEFKERDNSSAEVRRGCMGIIPTYIDNDRYEDWMDWIENGKMDKIQEYAIFLGPNNSQYFNGFLKNRTKYDVHKFDCFSRYIKSKQFLSFLPIISLLFLI